MDPLIAASLIAGGTSLLGGGLNNMFGGGGSQGLSRDDQRWMADFSWKQSLRNEQFQQDLARNGIRMRVDDAVAAGLHPLVGAGINPASGGFSAGLFGGSPEMPKSRNFDFVGNAGQNIARAMTSTMTQDERLIQHANAIKAEAEADFAQSQALLARREVNGMGRTPPIPSHIQIQNPDGSSSMINNPDIAGGLMSDPLGAWGTSIHNTTRSISDSPKWGIIPGFLRGLVYTSDSAARGRDRRRYPIKR